MGDEQWDNGRWGDANRHQTHETGRWMLIVGVLEAPVTKEVSVQVSSARESVIQ
jgi:hypothetical protein